GIGLLRTEIPFLGRSEEPSVLAQRTAYAEVLRAFPGRLVVARTLDGGGDKPLPFLGVHPGQNPALGARGVRTVGSAPGVLERQLTALALAAEGEDATLAVMAPMVALAAEARDFAARARAAGIAQVGVMVEIP